MRTPLPLARKKIIPIRQVISFDLTTRFGHFTFRNDFLVQIPSRREDCVGDPRLAISPPSTSSNIHQPTPPIRIYKHAMMTVFCLSRHQDIDNIAVECAGFKRIGEWTEGEKK